MCSSMLVCVCVMSYVVMRNLWHHCCKVFMKAICHMYGWCNFFFVCLCKFRLKKYTNFVPKICNMSLFCNFDWWQEIWKINFASVFISLWKAFLFIERVYDFYGHIKSGLLYYYRLRIQEAYIKSNICVVYINRVTISNVL